MAARCGATAAQRPRRATPRATGPSSDAASGAEAPSAPAPAAATADAGLFDGSMAGSAVSCWSTATASVWPASWRQPDGEEAGDRVAAELAGVSREAARATRLLGLGTLARHRGRVARRQLVLAQPTADTVLLAMRATPRCRWPRGAAGRARRARRARTWLEAQ